MGFFKRLKESIASKTEAVTSKFRDGLAKTRDALVGKVGELFSRRKKIDEEFFEELEEILIGADVGVNTVMALIDELRDEVKKRKIEEPAQLQPILSEKLVEMLRGSGDEVGLNENPNGITVILFVGVNGVGKTTTIGKLAWRYKQQGKNVLLAAGDTFRAGAIEQLEVWGGRVGVDVIKQVSGADPAAVMFDAVQEAKRRNVDVLICDTAGRLQNKHNLMEELAKIHRVIQREIPSAPHETLLAWTGLLSKAPPGAIWVSQPNDDRVAHMGELSAETLKNKGVRGAIVDGFARDVNFLIEIGFQTWCRGFTPRDIVGIWLPEATDVEVTIGDVVIAPGDYLVGDRDGLIRIPRALAEEVAARAEAAIATENLVRKAILSGVDPQQAYLTYGKF